MTIRLTLATSSEHHLAELVAAGAGAEPVAALVVATGEEPSTSIVEAVASTQAEVVVVDDDGAGHPEDLVPALVEADPTRAVVVWARPGDRHAPAAALAGGARGVLARPLVEQDAAAQLAAAARWTRRLRGERTAEEPAATMVALVGAKGGVGTTTLAIHLARLAHGDGRPTVLVDLDLGGADVGDVLDVAPGRTVLDLAAVADHLDDRYVADALHVHPCGVQVLPGPTECERADEVGAPAARRILAALRHHAAAVVVDCGSRLDDATAVALEEADGVLLVTTPDVGSLLAGRRTLADLDRLSIRAATELRVVVDRCPRRPEVEPGAAARALEVGSEPLLVPDRPGAFRSAVERGEPAALEDRVVRRALGHVARSVDLVAPPARRSRGARGSAAIELLGLVPLLLAVLVLVVQSLAAASASGAAGDAARAGAWAAGRGADPAAAVHASLPAWLDARVRDIEVRRRRDRVRVVVRLAVPGATDVLPGATVVGEATAPTEEH